MPMSALFFTMPATNSHFSLPLSDLHATEEHNAMTLYGEDEGKPEGSSKRAARWRQTGRQT